MARRKSTPKKQSAAITLNDRERLFVVEYLKDLNQTKAAIRAGYAPRSARQQASRLMTKAYIADAIAAGVGQREEKVLSDSDWLLKRLRDEAEADIADLYDDEGNIRPVKEWPAVWRKGLIVGIESMSVADGSEETAEELEPQGHGGALKRAKKPTAMVLKVRYADRIRRLELIGRHTNVQAWKDKVQHDLTDPLKKLAAQILGNSIRPKDDGSGNAGGNGPNPMVRE